MNLDYSLALTLSAIVSAAIAAATWRRRSAAGDDLLRRAARVLKLSFRREDRVARIGGDEFVAILPNTDYATAMKIVERFKNLLNEHNLDYPANLALSLSVGMACGEENSVLSEMLIRADQAMYDEKEKKKTRLVNSV